MAADLRLAAGESTCSAILTNAQVSRLRVQRWAVFGQRLGAIELV